MELPRKQWKRLYHGAKQLRIRVLGTARGEHAGKYRGHQGCARRLQVEGPGAEGNVGARHRRKEGGFHLAILEKGGSNRIVARTDSTDAGTRRIGTLANNVCSKHLAEQG